jgi:two-component system, OmpR family, sensor kinase
MRTPPLRQQLVLAACGAVVAALIAVSTLFYVVLQHRLDRDASDTLRTRAQAALTAVTLSHGQLALRESPHDQLLDQGVWVFQGTRAVDRPFGSAAVQRAAGELANLGDSQQRDVQPDARLRSVPVTEGGRRVGTVVAAVSLQPFEHTAHLALIAVLVLDAVILVVFFFFARMLVRNALRPVAWMTEQATEWSEHDLDRRFALGPPRDELTALAATLDALLGRLGASLRHEQRFSAEMAHELRTPLTSLRGEAELALATRQPTAMRTALEAVLRQTDRITQVVDTLVTAAQREADPHRGTVPAQEASETAAAACEGLARERRIALEVKRSSESVEVDADAAITTQILVPIVENGLRYGRSRVRVEYVHEGESVVFRVSDDGPGVSVAEAESIFAPGARGSAGSDEPGAGLGLALARRLARAAGGDVSAEPAGNGGSFAVRLPAS